MVDSTRTPEGFERSTCNGQVCFVRAANYAELFTRLVRDLLGLDCALIYYPGHLAAAVRFAQTPTGVCYSLNGKDYTLCDPTYINARVGMEMPKIDNTNVTLIPL